MVANMSRTSVRSSSSNVSTGRVGACITGVPQRVIGSTRPPIVRSSSTAGRLAPLRPGERARRPPTRTTHAGRGTAQPDRGFLVPGWRLARTNPRAHSDGVDVEPDAVRDDEPATAARRADRPARGLPARAAAAPGPVAAHAAGLPDRPARPARPTCRRAACVDLAEVDLRDLRGWLAAQQAAGRARTTLQRRSAAVHGFFRWAEQTGRLPRDPSAALPLAAAAPAAARPPSARPRPTQLLDRRARGGRARTDGPVGPARRRPARGPLRHRRPGGRAVRPRHRRRRPRPRRAAGLRQGRQGTFRARRPPRPRGGRRLAGARPARRWPAPPPATPCSSASAAAASTPGWCGASCTASLRMVDGAPDLGPARAAPRDGHPPARGRRRPAQRPGDARARLAGDDADLHPRHRRTAPRRLPPGPPPRLSGAEVDPAAGFLATARSRTRHADDAVRERALEGPPEPTQETRQAHSHVIGSTMRPSSQTIRCRWQPGGEAGPPDVADDLPAPDLRARADDVADRVVVRGHDPCPSTAPVVDEQPVAVADARDPPGHPPGVRRPDRGAAGGTEVGPVVQLPDVQHRVEAAAERARSPRPAPGGRSRGCPAARAPARRATDPTNPTAAGRRASTALRAASRASASATTTARREDGTSRRVPAVPAEPGAAHQHQRVEVGLAALEPPVQAAVLAVRLVPDAADHLALPDPLADPDRRLDRLEGRADAAVVDDHDGLAADPSRRTRPCRPPARARAGPAAASRSTPRCPGTQGWSGGSKPVLDRRASRPAASRPWSAPASSSPEPPARPTAGVTPGRPGPADPAAPPGAAATNRRRNPTFVLPLTTGAWCWSARSCRPRRGRLWTTPAAARRPVDNRPVADSAASDRAGTLGSSRPTRA